MKIIKFWKRKKISMEIEIELARENLLLYHPYLDIGKAIDIFKDKYGVRPTHIVLPKFYLRDFKRKFKEKYWGAKDLSFKNYRHYYFFRLKIIRGNKFALGILK